MSDSYLDTNGERQPYTEPPSQLVGGYFEDETGWWRVDSIADGLAWLIGRGGVEREVAVRDLPRLTYCEEAK